MTAATVEQDTMAKRKGRPAKPTGEGTPVRIDSDIVSMARYIAGVRDCSVTELLSGHLRPIIEREMAAAARELAERLPKPKGKPDR